MRNYRTACKIISLIDNEADRKHMHTVLQRGCNTWESPPSALLELLSLCEKPLVSTNQRAGKSDFTAMAMMTAGTRGNELKPDRVWVDELTDDVGALDAVEQCAHKGWAYRPSLAEARQRLERFNVASVGASMIAAKSPLEVKSMPWVADERRVAINLARREGYAAGRDFAFMLSAIFAVLGVVLWVSI